MGTIDLGMFIILCIAGSYLIFLGLGWFGDKPSAIKRKGYEI